MRILFLTPQLPYPPHKGTSIRNFHLIKNLAVHHEVHLLTFVNGPTAELGVLKDYCSQIHTVVAPKRSSIKRFSTLALSLRPDLALRLVSPQFASQLDSLLATGNFDLVQVEGLELASYFLALDKRKLPPVVLDDHNAEYRLQEEAFALDRRYPQRWLGAFYSWMQWHKLLSYEKAACRRAQAVIAVSEEDRQALLQLNTQLDVTVVPNGVDVEYYQNLGPPPAVSDLNLLFTGTMDFRPNVDAVVWFCQDVLPRIQRHVSHLRFLIVGQSPNATVRRLIGPGVVVTGAVPDVRPYMAQASVYVVPMRIGSGVRLKALEAMAYGIPVVSTKVGVQGIAVTPSRHFLLADRAQEFAAQVVKLLTDSSRRQSLAQEAQKLLRERYDWQVIVPRLEEVYLRVRAGAYL